MKLIKQSFEILDQQCGLEGIYKQIERAGRTCYKSEDKITGDSAKEFVDRMVKSGHGAMLEHGTVYLKITYKDTDFATLCMFYGRNKYSVLNHSEDNKIYYITTNYRVLVENNHLSDLKYLCEPTEFHEKRITVRFVCDRGVSHEYVRHRVFSFAQESTRYCNYSKDKFNNEITYILPCWIDNESSFSEFSHYLIYGESLGKVTPEKNFIASLQVAEQQYFELLNQGWNPQQARAVLPNSLKTELVMTGVVSDWKHFFELRCDSKAHPQARELAIPLREEFIKTNLI